MTESNENIQVFFSATMVAPFFLLFLLTPLVNTQNLSSEYTILMNLNQHWGNPSSLHLWNSLSPPCDWPEVGCASGSIISLNLAEKNINGTIPSAICRLKNLRRINLSKNKMSGRIPSGLYNCSNLDRLDLSMNELSGTIPGELFLMQNLQYLNISANRLFGGIPTPIQAYSLESMDLSYNNLNGSIPEDFKDLYNLRQLDLSMNSFSDSIPWGLFHMHQLSYMILAYNNLTGELPTELDLFSLQELNLSHNHFYGVIPESFGYLQSFISLDLSDNQLSGDIIQNLFHLQSRRVRLCSNKFSGQIPLEFVNQVLYSNCLDLHNLCSDNKTERLPVCPSNLCFDSRIRPFLNCKVESGKKSTTAAATIMGTIGVGVAGFAICCYLARKCWKMVRVIIAARSIAFPLNDKYKEWEMIAFQKLGFDKSDILSSLIDDNLIGNGGSGKVYRVVINQTGNTIAVKSIWNDQKSDERLDKEFMAEIQTLGTIRHNNIVKLLCYISGKDSQLLVYEYFENKSLDQWLHDNKMEMSPLDHRSIKKVDWPMKLHIAIGVAQGLCYMHHHCSPPILHRDIKPSNILLDSEFNAKIADFGLAKMLTKSGDTEIASAVAGTFGYIAPEYAYKKRVSVKNDVYSYGVVLLELTTGRKAVSQDDHMNLAGRAQMQYREMSSIDDLFDAEIKESSFLDQIVAVFKLGVMCTNESPSNRPTMRDCLHILQDCNNRISSSSSSMT